MRPQTSLEKPMDAEDAPCEGHQRRTDKERATCLGEQHSTERLCLVAAVLVNMAETGHRQGPLLPIWKACDPDRRAGGTR